MSEKKKKVFRSRPGFRAPFKVKPARGARRGAKAPMRKEVQAREKLKETAASAPYVKENEAVRDWVPKTSVGKLVQAGEITSIEEVWSNGHAILEAEVIDTLVPDLEEKVIDTRKTAYVRSSGRKFNFSAYVLVGDGKRYIGLGVGSDKERFPAIRKAARNARLNLIPVHIGSGSWDDFSNTTKSVPFKVTGKAGSVRVTLHPAPRGTGLVVGQQIQDVFKFAGITDLWGQTKGSSDTRLNYVMAAYNALKELNNVHLSLDIQRKFSQEGGHL